MRFGLLAKFSISVSLVIILTFFIFSLFVTEMERGRVERELENKGRLLARNLAYDSEASLLSRDIKSLIHLIQGVMEEEDVAYIQITDTPGAVLAQAEKPQASDVLNLKTPVVSRAAGETEEKIIGSIKLGISLARVRAIVNQLLLLVALLATAATTIGVLSVYVLSKYLLINPLQQFVSGTERIAQGNLTQKINITSQDEIGNLASSFNEMAEELNKANQKLALYTHELENKVAERTAELQKRTQELEKVKTAMEENTSQLQEKLEELQDFHDSVVSRELKMIELEKEIERLKKK